MIPPSAKAKVLPIMLPVSVRSTMPLSEPVIVMTIILNAMLRPGVNKTVITLHPAPFRSMLMSLVRVTGLCIKVVRPIMTGLVRILVIRKKTSVRQVKNSKRIRVVVLMILLMVLAVRRPVVRLIRL